MADGNETQAAKINRNLELLRQVFEPLTAGLPPDVEPAVIYFPQQLVSESGTGHDD